MRKSGSLAIAITICLAAAPATAQTSSFQRRAFVDVPVGADWDDAYSHSTRVPGATWRGGVTFGLDAGRSGVEIDASVPQWHVKTTAPARYRYAGTTFGWQQQNHTYEWSGTVRRRSSEVMVFYRGNLPVNRRITITWLAGGGQVFRPEQGTTVTKEVLPDGRLVDANTSSDSSSRNYMAAAARLEAEFRLAPHLSVVPRLRVTLFPSLLDDSGLAPRQLVARPEIAVRWGF